MGRLLLMIIYSLYSGFVGEGINNAAHIGGFVSGMAIALLLWLFFIHTNINNAPIIPNIAPLAPTELIYAPS